MNDKSAHRRKGVVIGVFVTITLAAIIAAYSLRATTAQGEKGAGQPEAGGASAPGAPATVELSESQLPAIKVERIGTYLFPLEKAAVGSIDFDEDLSVPVFSPYQGKIITAFAQLGEEVEKGQPLYTIESPDLVQAESNLIAAAATLDLTNKELARAKELYGAKSGVSQRELEQAISDQQTAEGGLRAARSAVRVFGKSETEIDQIIESRKIDPVLVVPSPISGQITLRNAQPGLLVQPGTAPAPYSVADVSTKWLLANVTESDSPLFRTGMPVKVSVMALPEQVFEAKISTMAATVDPNTRRVMVRSEVLDPKHELRPGMFANFVIQVEAPKEAPAIAFNGVVREGDGSMTAWVATDKHHFAQRKVKLGLQTDGRYQVLDGLKLGELAVTDGAVFLSNILEAGPAD